MRDADIERRSVDELVGMVVRGRTDVLTRMGGLESLARADAFEIAAHLRIDRDAASEGRGSKGVASAARAIAAAFELGRRLAIEQSLPRERLDSADEVAAWARPRLVSLTHEELWLLALDGRGHLRAARLLARGGLHGAAVRAVDPLRAALRVDACAFVLVHNHPSGDPVPSREDRAFTEKVAAGAAVAGLPMLDHVVVAREGFACVPFG